ncbi:Phosphoserine phosphatase [hydrothermal vent metagenome]|uniref:Phosphoserine phosphatase n=1 Tax=hydrothermal vent metagenome TaxID=652676 RepID=A0A3B0WB24_9ZZZZ
MALALFDLDNTLLSDDSDFLWGCFLVDNGLVDKKTYDEANQRFYDEYKKGTLDIFEFLAFSLKPLTQFSMEKLAELHNEFMQKHIAAAMTKKGLAKIQQHRNKGDTTLIITATNSFVTGPIAKAFQVDALIATEPEIIDGKYTGKVAGIPCFQEGKITRLNQWLESTSHNLEGSTFYSDSHNDLALLEIVSTPIAVDPDDKLKAIALKKNWEILSFR